MSESPELQLTEVGAAAATAMREILDRAVGDTPVAVSVNEPALGWDAFRRDGWDLLGAAEADGGAGASLRDLAHLAQVWGEFLVPLPLMPAILAKRWSPAARGSDGAVTVAVPTPATPGRATIPFGADGLPVLSPDASGDALGQPADVEPDDYAPSLRIVTAAASTPAAGGFPAAWAAEIAVVWAGEGTGCARRALADAVAYARQREQFGQPIGRFQAVKHHLADAHMLAEQAESAVIWGSNEPAEGLRTSVFALNAALRVTEIAIQVHGGLGFTWEMGVHLYGRHIVALRELVLALAG
jgi:Acyl-CoA dehydrogenase, C-terminal domain